jgi:hypothetical protein
MGYPKQSDEAGVCVSSAAGRRDPRDKAIQSVSRDVSTRDFTAVRDGGTDLEAMADDTRPHYLDDGGELKWS